MNSIYRVLFLVLLVAPIFVRAQSPTAEIPPVLPAPDESHFGEKISRTMTDLATSTPEDRKKVRVLFYGQSITAQAWSQAIGRRLKKEYPNADLTIENRAIGGFMAERLVKTAEQDLYPYYPDLVIFHVYGGLKGELETIISNIRRRTTAEIVLATHHVSHPGNESAQVEHEQTSQLIRDLAAKYDCELVEVREEWKKYLADNHLQVPDLLQDTVHLNPKGCALMEALIWRHLRYSPAFSNPHADWIKTVPVTVVDGKIKIDFTGNRIDALGDRVASSTATASVLIDGRAPSQNPLTLTCTRPSKAYEVWWPALYTMGHKTPLQVESWTLKLSDFGENGAQFKYTLTGSKTGPDGFGDSTHAFISNSGRVVIEPSDFGIQSAWSYSKKPCPEGFEIRWSVISQAADIYIPNEKGFVTLAQGIENGLHTLEIIPNDNKPVAIRALKIYTPPLK